MKIGVGPEPLFMQVSDRATGTVAGKARDTAVRIDDLTIVIGIRCVQLFEDGDAVSTCPNMAVTYIDSELSDQSRFGNTFSLDNDIVVGKAVEFTEWDALHLGSHGFILLRNFGID